MPGKMSTKLQKQNLKQLMSKKSEHGTGEYPVATIACYGPSATLATKVVVGIFLKQSDDPEFLERWYSEEVDVRLVPEIAEEVAALLKKHAIKTVVAPERILGCPHEEGIDYPEGARCPKCSFWAHRDRFSHDLIL